jgi:hypothetical protein
MSVAKSWAGEDWVNEVCRERTRHASGICTCSNSAAVSCPLAPAASRAVSCAGTSIPPVACTAADPEQHGNSEVSAGDAGDASE